MGFDWRNTRASEIYRNGLCLDEVAEYVEVNWSTIRAARERRRLMRKMAMSELMHDQPSDEELQRMRNLNLSSSEVSQYAQRFASSALGRARIVEEIIEAAV
ncbi:MAG: hypothetical protein U0103_23815 [Candidatus Obscuribacterales bacterium]